MNNYLYKGADDFFENEYYKSHFVDKKLKVESYDNAIVLPFKTLSDGKWGGGVVADGYFLRNSGVHFDSTVEYDVSEDQIETDDSDIIYVGLFNGVWGHNITDDLRRFWIVIDETYKDLVSNCKFAYIPLDGFKFSDSFLKLLKAIGITKENLVPITKVTRFHKVHIPDECFYKNEADVRFFCKEYRDLINHIKNYYLSHIENEIKTYDRIYFTYSKYKKNVSYGEKFLERFFSSLDYEIIAPEDYPLEEQIVMLSNCKSLVSTIGSCAHNCIFMSTGAELILIPRTYCLTGYQLALNEVSDLKVSWIDSSLSNHVRFDYPYLGPYCLSITSNLLKSFGKETSIFTSEDYKEMIKTYCLYDITSLWRYKHDNTCAPEYYSAAVDQELSWIMNNAKVSRFGYKLLRLAAFFKKAFNRSV